MNQNQCDQNTKKNGGAAAGYNSQISRDKEFYEEYMVANVDAKKVGKTGMFPSSKPGGSGAI